MKKNSPRNLWQWVHRVPTILEAPKSNWILSFSPLQLNVSLGDLGVRSMHHLTLQQALLWIAEWYQSGWWDPTWSPHTCAATEMKSLKMKYFCHLFHIVSLFLFLHSPMLAAFLCWTAFCHTYSGQVFEHLQTASPVSLGINTEEPSLAFRYKK